MAIDLAPELLDILACPNCHGSLAVDHDRDELVCLAADCGLAYPVRQGIPVLLIDEARRPGPDLPLGSASSASSASSVEASSAPSGSADAGSADVSTAGTSASAQSVSAQSASTDAASTQSASNGSAPGSASAGSADGDERS